MSPSTPKRIDLTRLPENIQEMVLASLARDEAKKYVSITDDQLVVAREVLETGVIGQSGKMSRAQASLSRLFVKWAMENPRIKTQALHYISSLQGLVSKDVKAEQTAERRRSAERLVEPLKCSDVFGSKGCDTISVWRNSLAMHAQRKHGIDAKKGRAMIHKYEEGKRAA